MKDNYFEEDNGDSQLCDKCRQYFDAADGVYDYHHALSSPIFYCDACARTKQFYPCDKCNDLVHLNDLSEDNLCETCQGVK